ncbi:MAG: prepilin-type N-terminal cleavage/methylation domain-containing protein [Nitrospirae bacterium]|nr:prepilin-type N-terminal cleavage/methylation domain-containing protein [Nitrospirota bacterium]
MNNKVRSQKSKVKSYPSIPPFLRGGAGGVITRYSQKGFTLLELIIAITILSLITIIIGSAFRLGIGAWEKGERETSETQRLRVLSGLLSQQLKSAYPYKMKLEDQDEEVVLFKGDPESFLFVTSLTDARFGGFKWIRYSVKEGELLYKEGVLPDKKLEDNIKGKEELVDENIGEFKIEYYSSKDDEWKEKWDYGKDLPSAIQVKISYFQPFVISLPMSLQQENEDDDQEKKFGNEASQQT